MWEYSEKVKEYYRNPKNAGMMEDATTIGYAGSIGCGDAITLFLKINDNEIVTDAKFLGYGCAAAISSASILTEIVIGKNIQELKKITNQDIIDALGGLPEPKIHCSIMCEEVVAYAVSEYQKQKN